MLLTVIAPHFLPQAPARARAATSAICESRSKKRQRLCRDDICRTDDAARDRIAEHVQSWCDIVCLGYAEYARLALYSQGGFVGEPVEKQDARREHLGMAERRSAFD